MSELNSQDFQLLSQCLAKLYLPCRLEDFPSLIIDLLKQLVGSDISICHSFDSIGVRLLATDQLRFLGQPAIILPQYFSQEPVIKNLFTNNQWDAHKTSDFVTPEELYRNDIVYELFYKFACIEEGIAFALHDSYKQPDLRQFSFQEFVPDNCNQTIALDQDFLQTQKTLGNIFLILGRSQRSFTERDRIILNLLRPHFLVAYHNVLHYNQLQQQLGQLAQITEGVASILLSADGQVEYLSDRATAILESYFSSEWISTRELPETLHSWLKEQIQGLKKTEFSRPFKPLRIQRLDKIFSVRLLKDSSSEGWILTFEEEENPSYDVKSFYSLGLTRRESEVMFWVVKGLSNAQIANKLFCSDKTIKKHLEHIYSKLNVQSRSMAVAFALNKLYIN